MFMTYEFKKHMRQLKKKDEIAIKKSERRLNGTTRIDKRFQTKASDVYEVMSTQTAYIATVLKEYIDNPMGEQIFGKPFSEAMVRSVLNDYRFVASLITSNLLMRAIGLGRTSNGQLKLRVYIAILNFDYCQKNEARK